MNIQYTIILPEILLAGFAMLLLMIGVFSKSEKPGVLISRLGFISLLIVLWQIIATQLPSAHYTFRNGFVVDNFGQLAKALIILSGLCILLLSFQFFTIRKPFAFEFVPLLLLSLCGMAIMISANDLIVLYLGLELQSLSLYVLTAIRREDSRGSEAGLKYFMLGALASGLFLFGTSLLYGFSGTINFDELAALHSESQAINAALLVGFIFVMVALFFKISAAPFHMWTPDIYEGAPKIVTAFFATAPKVAALALLIRFVFTAQGHQTIQWQQVIIAVSILTMFIGAVAALRQHNIKRLMAYSSIGHVGFMLVGLAAATPEGVKAMLIYLMIYLTMNIGTFACIILMKRRDQHLENIGELSGLAKLNPLLAAVLAILMLSMAGIPPLAGFFGKWFIFQSALQSGLYSLAVLGVVASVISAFYYLRIIKVMYFDEANEPFDSDIASPVRYTFLVAAAFNLLFFISPSWMLNIAAQAAYSLF